METDKQQSINIATMGVQIDTILKTQQEIKVLIKEEIVRIKESFGKQFEGVEIEAMRFRSEQREKFNEYQSHLDNLCSRTKILEKDVLLLEDRFAPIKKISEENKDKIDIVKTDLAVSKTKLAGLILILTVIFNLVAQTVWDMIAKR